MTTDTAAAPIPVADKLAKAESNPRSSVNFLPLGEVTSPVVTTEAAAHYLNRRPQTLRIWSMKQTGPIACLRISGRLAWPTAALKKLLGVA